MYTMKKFTTAALLITVFAGLAAASTADMTIFPKESSTKINSFTSYEVNIENVGPTKDVYDLSSNSPREVSIAPQQVELGPNQEKKVNVWYNPDTNKEEGTYSFDVTATSQASGDKYSVEGTVNVIADHQVNLQVSETSKTGCLGQQVTYNVEVTNTGLQKEEFELSTGYGELSRNRLTLEDGETQNVTLTASADEVVEENFNIVAASTTSYAQDIQNINFDTEVCYASDISLTPEQKDVAAFTETDYTVTVRNTGTKADTFTLSSNIGELEDTQLDIDGKSSEETTLTVRPETLETQEIQVTAESTVTSTDSATLNVQNGMNMALTAQNKAFTACEDEEGSIAFKVENTGVATEMYDLEVNTGELTEEELQLEPDETEVVSTEINTSNLDFGTHDVTLTAAAQTFGQPTKTSTSTLTVENCWDLSMNVVPNVASAGENRSTIYEIQLNNTGTRENTYELSHEGPEWVSVKPQEVTIPAGESDTAYIYAGIPFQKKGEVKVTAISEGNQVRRTEEVTLLIGKDVQEAIESQEDRLNGLTGAFSSSISNFVSDLGSADNLAKAAISIIVGLAISAVVLLSEW
jgi:hypothetical protein